MRRWAWTIAFIALVGLLLPGCAVREKLDDQVASYSSSIDEMMAQGGKRRAPREMARAVVYLEAAKEEISERDYDAARDDLTEVERSLVKVRRYIEGPPEDEKLTDIDKDGIPDYLDLCPTIPETVNGHQDDDGCPDVAY